MTAPARPRRRTSPLARREALWGYLFIAPWVIGFLWFVLGPMIASLGFTFTNINLAQEEPLAFIGLRNYQTLLGDAQAWAALAVTIRFALIQLPVILILPFLLAIGLNARYLYGASAFRVLFFLPYVVPFVSGV